MTALQCDICGGSLTMDAGGEFATCESCGMKHDRRRMQQKVQEIKGTVKIEGAVQIEGIANFENLMKRGYLALEDSAWKQAGEHFDRVLDIDPEYAPAYIGKLCAELEVRQESDLPNAKGSVSESFSKMLSSLKTGEKIKAIKVYRDYTGLGLAEAKAAVERVRSGESIGIPIGLYANLPICDLSANSNYQKALRFSDENYRTTLERYGRENRDALAQEAVERAVQASLEEDARIAQEEARRSAEVQIAQEKEQRQREIAQLETERSLLIKEHDKISKDIDKSQFFPWRSMFISIFLIVFGLENDDIIILAIPFVIFFLYKCYKFTSSKTFKEGRRGKLAREWEEINRKIKALRGD